MKVKEFQYAFLNVGGALLWLIIEKLTGLHDRFIHLQFSFSFIALIFTGVVYFLAYREKKEFVSLQKGIEYGAMITAISAPLIALVYWLFFSYVSTEYVKFGVEYASLKMGKTQTEAETFYNLTSVVGDAFLKVFLFGGLFSVAMSYTFKSKKIKIQS